MPRRYREPEITRSLTRNTDYYRSLFLAMSSKRLQVEQSQEVVAPSGTSLPRNSNLPLSKEASLVQEYLKESPSSARLLAAYRPSKEEEAPTKVLIEWKDFNPENPHLRLISKRINDLAVLLNKYSPKPPDFRVLDCLGYFEDERQSRFGFLFELPDGAQPLPPTSLHDILARGTKSLPNLGERFLISRKIATSVIRLLDCGWVHAALRSENILFFQTSSHGLNSPELTSPYLLGFTYSRPQDPNEITLEYSQENDTTHNLYRHPEIQRSNLIFPSLAKHIRFQQRHDLFSLGIILLEIGLWEQIETLWKPKYTPEKFLDKLLTVYVPHLGHKMGEIYRNIVWELLAGDGTQGSTEEVGSMTERGLNSTEMEVDEEVKAEVGHKSWADLTAQLEHCNA